MVQQPNMSQPAYQYQQLPDNTDYSNFDFSNLQPTDQTSFDPNAFDPNNFNFGQNAGQAAAYGSNIAPAPSTELVRRTKDQQLAPQNGQQEQWNGFGSGQMEDEDEQDLDMKVAMAKKDAQGKRKQIPPFVQKLSR